MAFEFILDVQIPTMLNIVHCLSKSFTRSDLIRGFECVLMCFNQSYQAGTILGMLRKKEGLGPCFQTFRLQPCDKQWY